jgi:4-amino-4-deoxy-L-arabinose transferase-like glycosyltransferase
MLKRRFASSGAADSVGRISPPLATARALMHWAARNREMLWVALLLIIAAVARGWNMFHFPYYESDEGTYMSQAWAILRLGKLAPYTYWYDHAPAGWLQIALWTLLTGGFRTFGDPVNSGRMLMLLIHLASALMVYRIARSLSRSWVAPTIAVLAWMLSAYGTYYGRRVLLDNITVFWMPLSIVLLVVGQITLKRVWLSGLALGIAFLSKELTIVLVPALAYLVWYRVRGPQRALATIGWLAIVGAVVSSYIMLALLKGELFPTGTWLGGTSEHVSLLGSLQYQSSRKNDAGVLDWHSGF